MNSVLLMLKSYIGRRKNMFSLFPLPVIKSAECPQTMITSHVSSLVKL